MEIRTLDKAPGAVSPPDPVHRPKIRRWREARDLTAKDVGAACGKTREWARLIELPFGDPDRRIPSEADVERLYHWTGGDVGPADWYHPRLSADVVTDRAGQVHQGQATSEPQP